MDPIPQYHSLNLRVAPRTHYGDRTGLGFVILGSTWQVLGLQVPHCSLFCFPSSGKKTAKPCREPLCTLELQVWLTGMPAVLVTFLVAVTQYLIRSNACRRVPEGTAYGARKAWQRVQETTLGVQSGSRVENAGHHRPSPFWSDCGCHWHSVECLSPHLTQTRNTPRACQLDNDY